jgi:catechol 2,3-dioxygenase-like lactoylglutathione lyase family enzyme
MLNPKNIFASFSVKDTKESQVFYTQALGLDVVADPHMPDLLNIKLEGGAVVMVYPKGEGHLAAEFTVLNLIVDDIDRAVEELTEKGVEFEKYDNEYMKTDEKGIARGDGKQGPAGIAWFKDLSGNIMSLIQE